MIASNAAELGQPRDLEIALSELRASGFAHLGQLHDVGQIGAWRCLHAQLWPDLPCFGQAPVALEACFAHPLILAVGRAVLGPWMRLDTVVLKRFPVGSSVRDGGAGSFDWHRDRFGYADEPPPEADPLALTFITYLQDSTAMTGPLRVLPGSHRDRDRRAPRPAPRPLWGERCLLMPAGAVCVMDNRVLHSGSPNWSSKDRFYLAATLTVGGLPRTDRLGGRAIVDYRAGLRRRGRHDLLALVGGERWRR